MGGERMENLKHFPQNMNKAILDYSLNLNMDELVKVVTSMHNDESAGGYISLLLSGMLSKENADMQALVGDCYYQGKVVHKSVSKAVNCFKEAYQNGSIIGSYDLGWYYYDQNEFLSAIEYLEKCLDEKNSFDDNQISNIYSCLGDSYLDISEPKYSKALEYLAVAADKYHSGYANRRLGIFYGEKTCKYFDAEKCIKYYEQAAYLGDVDAAVSLGDVYISGDEELNVQKNLLKAEKILLPFSESDNPELLFFLGRLYTMNESDFHGDMTLAIKYFNKSYQIDKNWLVAAWLGYAYYTEDMYAQAEEMLLIADEHGCRLFSDFLGRIYKGGLVGNRDFHRARKYYGHAYENEGLNNMFTCAEFTEVLMEVGEYLTAYEVATYGKEQYNDIFFIFCQAKLIITGKISSETNMEKAADMLEAVISYSTSEKTEAHLLLADYYLRTGSYRKAESHYLELFQEGFADAGVYLGRLYEKGGGTIRANINLAYEWYEKAKNQGSELGEKEISCFQRSFFGGLKRIRSL